MYFIAPIRPAAASCKNRYPAAYIQLSTNEKRLRVLGFLESQTFLLVDLRTLLEKK